MDILDLVSNTHLAFRVCVLANALLLQALVAPRSLHTQKSRNKRTSNLCEREMNSVALEDYFKNRTLLMSSMLLDRTTTRTFCLFRSDMKVHGCQNEFDVHHRARMECKPYLQMEISNTRLQV